LFGQQESQSWLSDHLSRQFQSFSVSKGQQQFLGGHDIAQMFLQVVPTLHFSRNALECCTRSDLAAKLGIADVMSPRVRQ
jgi:hypothetical protein